MKGPNTFCIHRLALLFMVLGMVVGPSPGEAGQKKGGLYVTWEGIEVDKCASAWLIRSHVDTGARFSMVERGRVITGDGIPFDTPQGELRTTHQATTFDSILKRYELNDESLLHIAGVVRDVEMKRWDADPGGIARGVEAVIYGLSLKQGEGMRALEASFDIFDYLYEYFNALEK